MSRAHHIIGDHSGRAISPAHGAIRVYRPVKFMDRPLVWHVRQALSLAVVVVAVVTVIVLAIGGTNP